MSIPHEDPNFYQSGSFPCIEKAVLANDVIVSDINNTTGNFYIRVLTPSLDISTSYNNRRSGNAPSTSNYITLKIPSYMVMHFMKPQLQYIDDERTIRTLVFPSSGKIPAGTEFYVEFLGGDPLIEKISLVGIKL